MNQLAIELNNFIENTAAFRLLSDYGKRFYFPSKGIVAQAAQAKEKAHLYDATVGMACYQKRPIRTKQVSAFINTLSEEDTVAYAPTSGVAKLRSLWKDEIYRKNPDLNNCEISTPVVVPGLTAGISQMAELFFEKGTNLVIPDMFWGNYRLIFEGKRESKIELFPFYNDNCSMNLSAYKEALVKHAQNKQIRTLLNFPNNPTGYSPSVSEVNEMANIFLQLANEGYEILVIVDDAYFGLFYEEETYKQSIFAKLANLHENILAVKIDGATKEHFVWGFRVGFVTFGCKGFNANMYNSLVQKLSGSIRATLSNCSKIAQSIMVEALVHHEYEAERKNYDNMLMRRYKIVKQMLSKMPANCPLSPLPFNSGYFMTFKVSGDAEALRLKLLSDEGIGSISINGQFLRIAFSAVDEENIADLYTKIFECACRL